MTELDEMLMKMRPEIFEDNSQASSEHSPDDDPLLDNYFQSGEYPTDIIHQENVPVELARAVLSPSDFDADCRYQLVTMTDKTLLLKINEYAKVDSDNPVDQRITEFVLNTDDEVQTYDSMVKDILLPRHEVHSDMIPDRVEYKTTGPDRWVVVLGVTFFLLLAAGMGVWWLLLNVLS